MSTFNNPTDKDKEYDNIRLERLKQTSGKKPEEKLDNDEKNSYIDNNPENTPETPPVEDTKVDDKDKELLEKQFKNDPLKAVKSWREAQREYMKLRDDYKKATGTLENFDALFQQNPELQTLIEKVSKGELPKERLQSLLNGNYTEPVGKPNTVKSKLNAETSVDEKTLIKEGLIDPAELSYMTEIERSEAVRQAQYKYLDTVLPQRIAEKAAKTYEEQIAEREKQSRLEQVKQQNSQINSERYQNGVNQLVDVYGFDVTGEHKELLDEIDRHAIYIRDPENQNLIDEDAIILAAEKVMRKKGIKPTQTPKQDNTPTPRDNGFDSNFRQTPRSKEPQTFQEKLRQMRLANFNKDMQHRKQTRRTLQD